MGWLVWRMLAEWMERQYHDALGGIEECDDEERCDRETTRQLIHFAIGHCTPKVISGDSLDDPDGPKAARTSAFSPTANAVSRSRSLSPAGFTCQRN